MGMVFLLFSTVAYMYLIAHHVGRARETGKSGLKRGTFGLLVPCLYKYY